MYFISIVWLTNGLFCKVLNLIPRHEQIVGRILGNDFSRPLTILIGSSEIIMAFWILIRFKSRINAIIQIVIIGIMNIIEFMIAPDLLLWGRLNIIYALIFMGLIYYNEFILNKKLHLQS
ncbi:DoxX-like family protein [Pedobacter montanisoli]|uniref:DoxX-like family protein n=1 Tax=Pedobacter montanisoli TaxID=2923277 RepID=A0ABS9ZXF6_9SPHI|nr:DoxX-like family protein [Pedobacter montanisoli]MCJ0742997.1 DoxX-like family protein [Pedobacter montanisoli]